jgi:sialate O-acetylesterase
MRTLVVALATLAVGTTVGEAKLSLPAIFADGMVLQRSAPRLFGFANAGAHVSATVSGLATHTTEADPRTGRWMLELAAQASDAEFDVTVTAVPRLGSKQAETDPPVVLKRVTFGEVLLCGGQSNMVLSVAAASSGGINASDPTIQDRAWPTIHLFSVTSTLKVAPWAVNTSKEQRDLPAYNQTVAECSWGHVTNQANHVNPDKHLCQTWQLARPGVTDAFSAECFYTAVSLLESGAIPPRRNIGLVLSAYSGTSMETWTPPAAFVGCPNKTKVQKDIYSLPPQPSEQRVGDGQWVLPDAPSCLWNSMIAPISGFGLRAVIWNQGASRSQWVLTIIVTSNPCRPMSTNIMCWILPFARDQARQMRGTRSSALAVFSRT